MSWTKTHVICSAAFFLGSNTLFLIAYIAGHNSRWLKNIGWIFDLSFGVESALNILPALALIAALLKMAAPGANDDTRTMLKTLKVFVVWNAGTTILCYIGSIVLAKVRAADIELPQGFVEKVKEHQSSDQGLRYSLFILQIVVFSMGAGVKGAVLYFMYDYGESVVCEETAVEQPCVFLGEAVGARPPSPPDMSEPMVAAAEAQTSPWLMSAAVSGTITSPTAVVDTLAPAGATPEAPVWTVQAPTQDQQITGVVRPVPQVQQTQQPAMRSMAVTTGSTIRRRQSSLREASQVSPQKQALSFQTPTIQEPATTQITAQTMEVPQIMEVPQTIRVPVTPATPQPQTLFPPATQGAPWQVPPSSTQPALPMTPATPQVVPPAVSYDQRMQALQVPLVQVPVMTEEAAQQQLPLAPPVFVPAQLQQQAPVTFQLSTAQQVQQSEAYVAQSAEPQVQPVQEAQPAPEVMLVQPPVIGAVPVQTVRVQDGQTSVIQTHMVQAPLLQTPVVQGQVPAQAVRVQDSQMSMVQTPMVQSPLRQTPLVQGQVPAQDVQVQGSQTSVPQAPVVQAPLGQTPLIQGEVLAQAARLPDIQTSVAQTPTVQAQVPVQAAPVQDSQASAEHTPVVQAPPTPTHLVQAQPVQAPAMQAPVHGVSAGYPLTHVPLPQETPPPGVQPTTLGCQDSRPSLRRQQE